MALTELREDKSRVILTADMWEAMVVLDKQDYINKVKELLTKKDIYRPITADPTNQHKNKLTNLCRTINALGGLGDNTYKRFYPTSAGLQKF